MARFIHFDEVEKSLKDIESIVGELESLNNKIDADISSGWQSENSQAFVKPKIEEIKSNITILNNMIKNVHAKAAAAEAANKQIDTVA